MKKTFFVGVFFYILMGTCLISSDNDKYKLNLTTDPEGIGLFLSSITYNQKEEEKRFIGDMKIFLTDNLLLNFEFQTSEISEGIGTLGFLSFLNKKDTQVATGGKVSVGFTWSDYYSKWKKFPEPQQTYMDFIRNKYLDTITKKEQLKKNPWALRTYEQTFIKKEKEILADFLKNQKSQTDITPKYKIDITIFQDCKTIKALKEKLMELKYTETDTDKLNIIYTIAEDIDNEIDKANDYAIKEAITNNKELLVRLTDLTDLPPELLKKYNTEQEMKINNVWALSLNMGLNYTSIKYLDPKNDFKEIPDSYTGLSIQFKAGYFSNPSEMFGMLISYNKFGKAPQKTTIIQNFTIDDEPIIPTTLISKQVMLKPLSIQDELVIRVEYRKYIYSFFAFNPFIRMSYSSDTASENIIFALNSMFSFDKERNWMIGIQPTIEWKRGEDLKIDLNKPNVGISFYLSKSFKLSSSPWEKSNVSKDNEKENIKKDNTTKSSSD